MFHSYGLGFILLTLVSAFALSQTKRAIEEKMIAKIGNEGSNEELFRARRHVRKSPLKIGMFSPLICDEFWRRKIRNGRDAARTNRDTRRTQLGFFTEIHCRRLQQWLDHGHGTLGHFHGHKMRDCQDIQRYYHKKVKSGVYTIHPKGGNRIKVFCDMVTAGGGWTVFQHRYDGSVNFYRTWVEYKTGFGKVYKEFWLGNDNIHRLTEQGKYKLRIELEDFSGNKRYAEYSSFSIENENHKYKLHFGSYSGTAGNSLKVENNMMFTTKDRDNDRYSKSCSHLYKGGWWYNQCYYSNLNGLYSKSKTNNDHDNRWPRWRFGNTNMRITTMMIKKIR